jgi:hypothetical protein
MDTTLNSMATKKPDPWAEEVAARELVRLAREQGLSLAGPYGLLKGVHQERAGGGAERGDDRAPGA